MSGESMKKLTPEQKQAVTDEKAAREWWRTDGVYIDPDTEDVDWFDKRAELAQIAFAAGVKYARSAASPATERTESR